MIALVSVALAAPILGAPDRPNLAFATVGVGTSDPFRPGIAGPTLDTGALVAFRAWELAADVHREGDQALLLRGTSSVTSLGVTWTPTWSASPSRLVRVGVSPWLLLDLEPRTGLSAELAYGVQGHDGALSGFLQVHTPYWADAGFVDGATVGADLRLSRSFGLVQLRTGLAGLRRPMVALTVGAGQAWGTRSTRAASASGRGSSGGEAPDRRVTEPHRE